MDGADRKDLAARIYRSWIRLEDYCRRDCQFSRPKVIISTLGIIYSLGGDVDEEAGDLREAMASQKWQSGPKAGMPIFTFPVVIALMVFFALCH